MPRRTYKKIKIGTMLGKKALEKLKEQAVREGRSMSAVLETAILSYESTEQTARVLSRQALERFLDLRFNLSLADWKTILEEDFYEQ